MALGFTISIPRTGFTVESPAGVGFAVKDNVSVTPEPYTGAYAVTPSASRQVLETDGKRMTDDVTVAAIPVAYADNEAGGRTCTVG